VVEIGLLGQALGIQVDGTGARPIKALRVAHLSMLLLLLLLLLLMHPSRFFGPLFGPPDRAAVLA
jgi:hypothetical protein